MAIPGFAVSIRLIHQMGLIVLLIVGATGCMDATVLSYGPLTRTLDSNNELHISTYPAGFPQKTGGIPFLYKSLRTPDRVYFQVFIRDRGKKSGPNPHVESIHIRSFSYRFPGQESIELVSDFDHYFWMQGNPRYGAAESEPVPFDEHWHLRVRIDMTVNGKDFLIDERMDANSERNLRPLILYALE